MKFFPSPFRFLILLSILVAGNSCSKKFTYQITQNSAPLTVDQDIKADESLADFIEPYRDSLARAMDQVLVVSSHAHEKAIPEGKLGNLVSDIVFEKGNEYLQSLTEKPADFAVLNNGGLRAPIPQGSVSVRNVFELMPFENSLSVLTLSGEITDSLLHYIGSFGGVPVSGIRMEIKNGKPEQVLIGGQAFDPAKTYRIITSDYLANGGDKMYFFSHAIERDDLNLKIRNVLINALKEKGKAGETLTTELDGRIIKK